MNPAPRRRVYKIPGRERRLRRVEPQLSTPPALPVPWSTRVRRALRSALIAGLAFSLVVHVTGLVISGQIRFGFSSNSGAQGAPGDGDALQVDVLAGSDLAAVDAPPLEHPGLQAAADTAEPVSTALPFSDEQDEQQTTTTPAGLGGSGDIGGGQTGRDDGLSVTGGSGGGGGGASFFGVEARGNRFAYIIDVSGSMDVGGKLQSLQRELANSVSNLSESSSFVVFTFSSGAAALGGRKSWTQATGQGKGWAKLEIERLRAEGGTVPLPAFQDVLAIKPRPDAIYFMTDGEFESTVVEEVQALNRKYRVPVHCICFVSKDAEGLMRRIAQLSGGTYTFVQGPRP